MPTDLVRFTQAMPEIIEYAQQQPDFTGVLPPTKRQFYDRIVDGRIPAKLIREKWHLRRSDFPAIAAFWGLIGRNDPATM